MQEVESSRTWTDSQPAGLSYKGGDEAKHSEHVPNPNDAPHHLNSLYRIRFEVRDLSLAQVASVHS